MTDHASPLRYPGGKAGLAGFLADLLNHNELTGCVYAEPFAGGAGAALHLLFTEHVSKIILNDLDPSIYSFWKAVLDDTDRFISLLHETPLTMPEWQRQRAIYRSTRSISALRRGFATFYLNRCNRSGIIANGGPIGGIRQHGKWKLDARFNREGLARRIEKIVAYKDRIEIHNLDATKFLRRIIAKRAEISPTFVYLDPPYFNKGPDLYLNAYNAQDHSELANFIFRRKRYKWALSYDNVPQIRRLYRGLTQVPFTLLYSAYKRKLGNELVICNDDITLPRALRTLLRAS
jgi:DNA adenine methylase